MRIVDRKINAIKYCRRFFSFLFIFKRVTNRWNRW